MGQIQTPNYHPPLRHFQWSQTFSTRRPTLYKRLDEHLKEPSGASMIDEFLKIFTSRMQPPRRYETLRRFLQRTGARSLPEALRTCPTDKRALAMVDDRCDPSMGAEGTGKLRQWESEEYRRFPPSGLNVQVYGANAEMLYKQLQKDRRGVVERRVIYLADLTSLMALAIISHVPYVHLPELRLYLSRHLEFDAYINVAKVRIGFVLEFHLPHYVLRPDRQDLHDPRGLRKCRYFRPPGKDGDDCIYEAQLSLMVYGVDDYVWTAYFCGDSYFTGENPVNVYLDDEMDGPSGGSRDLEWPIWDPRFYFIFVLSARTAQVTSEWTTLVRFFEDYLEPHGEISPESLPEFLEDDPALDRTKEYAWILGILRRLRNSLAKLITTFNAFETNHSVYFDLDADGALQDYFREHFNGIRKNAAELGALHMILEQRIETLEKMASLLVNASALAESMTATRQGDHIRLLTYITILYLPMTLVTSAFSMSQVGANVAWWKYWVAMLCSTCITVGVAYGLQGFAPQWRKASLPRPNLGLPNWGGLSRRWTKEDE